MDHSVCGYLQRRTTEELVNILNDYLEAPLTDYEAEIVGMILEILKKRELMCRWPGSIAISARRKCKVSPVMK